MPRLPVDGKKVQELRVTLGTYERQQLDTLVTGMTIRNVATPTVDLLSDVSAMTFLIGLLELTGITNITGLDDWVRDVGSGIFDNVEDAIDAGAAAAEQLHEDYEEAKGTVARVRSFPTRLWVAMNLQVYRLANIGGAWMP